MWVRMDMETKELAKLASSSIVTSIISVKDDPKLTTSLLTLVKQNKTMDAMELLSQGVSVNVVGEHKRNAVHWSVINGNSELLKQLIDAQAMVGNVDSFGWTPFHYACLVGSMDVVKVILDKNPSEAETECNFDKILMERKGQFDGIDLNGFDESVVFGDDTRSYDWLPIHLAALMGHGDICEWINGQFDCWDRRTGNGKTYIELLNMVKG